MKAIIAFIITFVPIIAFSQISGSHLQLAVGVKATFTDPKSGGTWASSNTSIATVGSATGIATGVAQGSFYLTYKGDSLKVYVSTTDSSGFYFETVNSQKQLQQRDADGVTLLNIWAGDQGTHCVWIGKSNLYQIIFAGWNQGVNQNYTLTIPLSRIKDFGGSAPKSTADSVMTQIRSYGL